MTFIFKALGLLAAAIAVLGIALALYTWWGARAIARNHPPKGEFVSLNGQRFHLQWFAATSPTPNTYVFLHGASGNVLDQSFGFEATIPKDVNRLYIDRPGHGWSERRSADRDLTLQGGKIAALIRQMGAERGFGAVTLMGHSFGAAIAMEVMMQAPELVKNSVLLAPATHPWPSGTSSWYNALVARPIIGPLVAYTVILPFGKKQLASGARCVFAPNPMPDDYVEASNIDLVFRPQSFIANAQDVDGLYAHVVKRQPDYAQITTPIIVIAGDRDTVVADWLHTDGIVRDTQNATSILVHNLGHKPDYIATELAIAAMDQLNGKPRDLAAITKKIEAEIAGDQSGPCDLALRLKKEIIDAGGS